ncbi:MAG: DUF192 domain-containing protein [Acidithiobacillus ferrooxidans]|nr:DUF192 domain-containing protein [Acidithiobacillus ferrooxidans]MDD5002995.1 DUF192 domain-containing protein [Acidithiobacillus sp.]MDD5379203.1 DUF192 domain-containing protein [Acidithiobacillus sp.]MDD5576121.1 DUF192 domain-containing protein [Acidithiobacillus sp.]
MTQQGVVGRGDQVLWSEVRMAASFLDRLQGLLGKAGLSDQQGLLLTACGSIHTAGMGFPIDIIFLDADLKVLACHSRVRPWQLKSCRGARMTLEVAAGGIERHGVLSGQCLTWRAA